MHWFFSFFCLFCVVISYLFYHCQVFLLICYFWRLLISVAPDTEEDPNTLRETWLRETFERATRHRGGYIDQATCIQLIKRLDNQVATVRVKQKLQVGSSGRKIWSFPGGSFDQRLIGNVVFCIF